MEEDIDVIDFLEWARQKKLARAKTKHCKGCNKTQHAEDMEKNRRYCKPCYKEKQHKHYEKRKKAKAERRKAERKTIEQEGTKISLY